MCSIIQRNHSTINSVCLITSITTESFIGENVHPGCTKYQEQAATLATVVQALNNSQGIKICYSTQILSHCCLAQQTNSHQHWSQCTGTELIQSQDSLSSHYDRWCHQLLQLQCLQTLHVLASLKACKAYRQAIQWATRIYKWYLSTYYAMLYHWYHLSYHLHNGTVSHSWSDDGPSKVSSCIQPTPELQPSRQGALVWGGTEMNTMTQL